MVSGFSFLKLYREVDSGPPSPDEREKTQQTRAQESMNKSEEKVSTDLTNTRSMSVHSGWTDWIVKGISPTMPQARGSPSNK